MSEVTPLASSSMECDCIVYRVARKRWVQRTEGADVVLADAFMLRPQEKGLSVFQASRLSPEQCAAKLSNCNAALSLHVGRIRSIGLEVVAEDQEHAEILGLPPSQGDKAAEAEHIATLLVAQSRV